MDNGMERTSQRWLVLLDKNCKRRKQAKKVAKKSGEKKWRKMYRKRQRKIKLLKTVDFMCGIAYN